MRVEKSEKHDLEERDTKFLSDFMVFWEEENRNIKKCIETETKKFETGNDDTKSIVFT